ncbi:hypothetical protein GCM10010478_61030 [Streptomyces erythrogriseus]|uniref:Transposase n=1 Tax=Streptomyces erythrogriseus TaxID=284027 RepID=A0ABP6JZK3_9ACTN
MAGMLAGADSIDDIDVLRHGAMAKAFRGVRAPSTLGSFLHAFTWPRLLTAESRTGSGRGHSSAVSPLPGTSR